MNLSLAQQAHAPAPEKFAPFSVQSTGTGFFVLGPVVFSEVAYATREEAERLAGKLHNALRFASLFVEADE